MDSQENWTIKYAKKKLNLVSREEISDSDRYKTDRYEIVVSVISTNIGYSMSVHINNAQMGIAGYTQYWQYNDAEYDLALRTYRKAKKIAKTLVKKFEIERIPMSIISPTFRAELDAVDKDHQERSGVQNFNYYMQIHKEEDWRETLYGQRYPDLNFQHNNIMQNQHTDKSQSVETSGNHRQKQYKVKRASNDNQIKYASIKYASMDAEASLDSVKQWIQERWTRTGLPFTAGVLATATLFLSNGNWPGFEQVEKSLQAQQPIQQQPTTQPQPAKQTQPNQQEQSQNNSVVNIEDWISRIAKQESGDNPNIHDSPAGARGRLQIMPKTWAEWTKNLFGKPLPFEKAHDGKLNTQVATAYLKWIQKTLRGKEWMGREPGIEHILASYNGGIGLLRKNNFIISKMPAETRDYVARITGKPTNQSKIKQKIPQQKPKKMVNRVTHKITPDILPFETKQTNLFDKGAAVDMLSTQMSKCSSSDMANMPKLWTKIALKLKAKGMSPEAIEYLGNIYAAYSYHLMSKHVSDWKIKF